MDPFLSITALAVVGLTAVLVRRLVAPQPLASTGLLVALAVAVSLSALVTAVRGSAILALLVAALGVGAVLVALLAASDDLR